MSCWIFLTAFIQTALPVYAQVDQITVFSSADAFIDSSAPDANFGTGDLTITNSSLQRMIIWLKFNLSDVPDGAVITSAILQLKCNSAPEPFNVSSHFCSDNDWTEASITYNNAPWYDPTPMPDMCPTCGSKNWALVDAPLQWYLWDVTFAVNQTLDGVHGGPDVVTIVLEERWEHPQGVVAAFVSRDGPFQDTPKMRVAWSHIIPEFPTFHLATFLLTTTLLLPFMIRRKPETTHPA
ncbi:MAG: DNRLRE domain-containing protein [Candidatus Bathyarchaeota archaeon]|nr:MAG: DNRLRE domain-containing protein [Candidatus Bathyarchaeota archaeon]